MTDSITIPENYRPVVNVIKRKGQRRVSYWLEYSLPPQHGEKRLRRRVATKACNMAEATILQGRKQEELWRGEFARRDYRKMRVVAPKKKADITMEEFLPRFRKLRELGRAKPLSPRYLQTQERVITVYILPRFGKWRLADIDVDAIDAFVEQLRSEEHPKARNMVADSPEVTGQRRLSNKTVNNIVGILGRILTKAHSRGLIASRPGIEKLPVVHDEDFDFLSRDEVLRLFDACQGTMGNLIKAILLTGARAMEAVALRWEDYDPVSRRLPIEQQYCPYIKGKNKFRPPKWDSKRWVPVGDELARVLNDQAAKTRLQDHLIFYSDANKPVVHQLLSKALHRTCRRSGLRSVGLHVLRRTFISQMVMAGVDPKRVQQIAGHRSIHMTMKYYTRLEPDYVQGAAQLLDEHLFGRPGQPAEKLKESQG